LRTKITFHIVHLKGKLKFFGDRYRFIFLTGVPGRNGNVFKCAGYGNGVEMSEIVNIKHDGIDVFIAATL